MSIKNCPYCAIKAKAERIKQTAEEVKDVRCPDCGAYIDIGQHYVKVNGYKDIYNGAIKLIAEVVEQFRNILEYCEIDLKDYYDDPVEVYLHSYDIIDKLFVPYSGGTTKSNFANAIGAEHDSVTWPLQKPDEDEVGE